MWERWSHLSHPIIEDFTEDENVSTEGDAMAGEMSQVFEKPGQNSVYKDIGVSGYC